MKKIKEITFYTFMISFLGFFSYVHFNKIPIWKFFLEQNLSPSNISLLWNNNKIKIGTVIFLKGDVQRKKYEEYIFEPISTSNEVYFKDTFITAKNTRARIQLHNGSIIELSPNSMVKLDFAEENSFLDMKKKPVITVMTGQVTEVPTKEESKSVSEVKIIKSPFVVKKQVIKEIPQQLAKETPQNYDEIKKNLPKFEFKSVVPLEEQGRDIASKEPIVEKEIIVSERIYISYNVENSYELSNKLIDRLSNVFNVNLSYGGLNKNKDKLAYYHIVIVDKLNKQVLYSKKTRSNNIIYDSFLLPYHTFFRVKAYNNENVLIGESNVTQFRFAFNPPVIKNGDIGSYNILEKGAYVISWESTNFTSKYMLEISRDTQFQQIVLSTDVDKNFYAITDLPDGQYFLRVKSVNKNFESEWSKLVSFHINHKETILTKNLKAKKFIP